MKGFLGGRVVKHLSARQNMQVPSLSQGDPLEEEVATHSSPLDWKIPRTEEPVGYYSPWGGKELDTI